MTTEGLGAHNTSRQKGKEKQLREGGVNKMGGVCGTKKKSKENENTKIWGGVPGQLQAGIRPLYKKKRPAGQWAGFGQQDNGHSTKAETE